MLTETGGGTVKALPSTKERFALALRELLESNSFESISVGDIVAVKQDGKITANFVDTVGFTEIPDFTLSREERKARRTIDNLNLLAEKQLSSDEMDKIADALEASYFFGFEFKDGTKI